MDLHQQVYISHKSFHYPSLMPQLHVKSTLFASFQPTHSQCQAPKLHLRSLLRCPIPPNQHPNLTISLINHGCHSRFSPRKSGHQHIQYIVPYIQQKDMDKIPTALDYFTIIVLSYTSKMHVDSDEYHRGYFST